MIAVGNNELGKELGKTAKCPACSRELDVQSTGPLNTVKCSCGEGEVYLIGMNGREINQSTPDHTEDKLDEVGIRDYNNRLHDLAIKILFGSASSNRHGDFDPTSDEVKRAYELADTILTIGTTYEWNEYNGIDSLRFNKAEGEV